MSGEAFALTGYAQRVAELSVDLLDAVNARTWARKAHLQALRAYGWERGDSYETGEDEDVDRTRAFKDKVQTELTAIRRKHRAAVIRYRNFRIKVTGE